MSPNNSEGMLYIHIPYCVVKCPYCEFNSYSLSSSNSKQIFDEKRYTNAICQELTNACDNQNWQQFSIRSIFFGGGTPSLFSPKSIEQIIKTAETKLKLAPNIEITLEANPGTVQETVDYQKLEGYKLAGANRISLGAQSFIAEKLLKLGRIHKVDDTAKAVENILKSGISNFNLDLIFGVIGDTLSSWQGELEQAAKLSPQHISAYALTLEPGTPFHRQSLQGHLMTVDDELGATLFEETIDQLDALGYKQYELSNYSKDGFSCSHNRGYWQGLSYLGLGAGAHSYLEEFGRSNNNFGQRWSNTPAPLNYIEQVEHSGSAKQKQESLGIKEAQNEFFYLRLRTTEGFSEEQFRDKTGVFFSQKTKDSISFLEEEGLIQKQGEFISLTRKGKLVANSVLEELVEA